jgi:antitoxin VapB
MGEIAEAKLFMHGRSQAVRLPKAFRLPGETVRVRRFGRGVLLEPMAQSSDDIDAIFAALAAFADAPFMPEGRDQPPMASAHDIDLDA